MDADDSYLKEGAAAILKRTSSVETGMDVLDNVADVYDDRGIPSATKASAGGNGDHNTFGKTIAVRTFDGVNYDFVETDSHLRQITEIKFPLRKIK